MQLTRQQIEQLRHLRRELTAEAPVSDQPLRLVAGGFPSRPAATAVMLETFLPLMQEVATQRFGLLVQPMFPPGQAKAGGPRRKPGWGIFVRDRHHSSATG